MTDGFFPLRCTHAAGRAGTPFFVTLLETNGCNKRILSIPYGHAT